MDNSDIILEYLEENRPSEYCDDCISDQLGIKPRQQVNQICNRLLSQSMIKRSKGLCALCHGRKLVNAFNQLLTAPSDSQIDIEKLRTQIVHMCHELWKREKAKGVPKRGIAALINALQDENLLPRHQANMMHTLRCLRNVYVYEQIEMGPNEKSVAEGAWAIISEWWESRGK